MIPVPCARTLKRPDVWNLFLACRLRWAGYYLLRSAVSGGRRSGMDWYGTDNHQPAGERV